MRIRPDNANSTPTILFSLLSLFFIFVGRSVFAAQPADCNFPLDFHLVPGTDVYIAELTDNPVFWGAAVPTSPSYRKFQIWASRQPNLSPPEAKVIADRDAWQRSKQGQPTIFSRFQKVLTRQVGEITSIHCLEAMIFAQANEMREQANNPYEIGGAVLTKQTVTGDLRLRIYLVLGDATTVASKPTEELVLAALKDGWSALAHLHSHPFSLEAGFILQSGYTSPSEGDMQVYLRWQDRFNLSAAWITNGINSFRMRQQEFGALAIGP